MQLHLRSIVVLAALPLSVAARAPAPRGEIVLDADRPTVTATIEGVALTLRVDLAQHDAIELTPAAAARVVLPWEEGAEVAVGRVLLKGRTVRGKVAIDGHERALQLTTHDRSCCVDTDGVIGPDLLPYAGVTWRRADAPDAPPRTFPLRLNDETGLSIDAQGIDVRFALGQPLTVATLAGGALLAERQGGGFTGPYRTEPLAFGIPRPVRTLRLTRPATLAGFRIDTLAVRTADFSGRESIPDPAQGPADIVVRGRVSHQEARPWVTIGADRLSRCAEIRYHAEPRTLTLRCAADGAEPATAR